MFRKSLFTKRCVIPSTGFYEWSHDSKKQKYLFNLPESQALYMAGLYNEFDGKKRFVILTTDANSSIAEGHINNSDFLYWPKQYRNHYISSK